MKATIKILIADNSPLYRKGVKSFVDLEGADVIFIEAGTPPEVLTKAKKCDVLDLLILDKALLRMDKSFQLGSFLSGTNIPVILLCDTLTSKELYKIRLLGIQGVVSKRESIGQLNHAVNEILAGKQSWPESKSVVTFEQTAIGDCKRFVEHIYDLTHTEKRVMSYLNHGMMNKEIGYEMGIEENTVKRHVSHILQKIRVKNRTQLIVGLQSHIPTVKNRYGQHKETQCLSLM